MQTIKILAEEILNMAHNNPSGCDEEITDAEWEDEQSADIAFLDSSMIARKAKEIIAECEKREGK